MRRRILATGVAVAVLVAVLIGCAQLGIPFPPGVEVPTPVEPGGPQPDEQPGDAGPGEEGYAWEPVWEEAFEMTVVEIVDGDTIRMRIGRTNEVVTTTNPISVRLIGIDTPEVYPEEECFGPEAERALGQLAPVGTTLLVAPDVESWDDYNRRLFYAWTPEGVFLNEALALAGYAEVNRYPPNTTLQDALDEAERSARESERGLWGACG